MKNLPFDPPSIYQGRIVYEQPDKNSAQLHVVEDGYSYTIHRVVGGFDPELRFYEVSAESDECDMNSALKLPAHYYKGYLEIVEERE